MRGPRAQPCRPRRLSRWGAAAALPLVVLALAAAARAAGAQQPGGDADGSDPGADPVTFGNTTSTVVLDGIPVATGGTTDPLALKRTRKPKIPSSPAAAAAAVSGDRINEGASLSVPNAKSDKCLKSPNGRFRLCLLRTAEIALYDGSTAYWTAKAAKKGKVPLELVMQADGNLVAYTGTGASRRPYWASNTCCRGRPSPITAFIQDDGNLVTYDGRCTPIWASGPLRAPAVRPPCQSTPKPSPSPSPPPSPPPSSGERLPLKPRVVMGPFGGGDSSDPTGVFDHSGLAFGGSNPISKITVRSGSWIDGFQVAYKGTNSLWQGGGSPGDKAFTLASDEYITQAYVRAGLYVDVMWFVTNKGRSWSTFGDATAPPNDATLKLASPCPAGAYRLVAFQGQARQYLDRVSLIWAPVAGAKGALVSAVNQWTCQPGVPFPVKSDASGLQCLVRGGKCVEGDCLALRQCADLLAAAPVDCSAGAAQDLTSTCARIRNALGMPAPAIAARILFLNVNLCGALPAVDDVSKLRSSLYDDPHSLKQYWRAASFGRVFFDESTSRIADLALPCDGNFAADSCNFDAWVDYVRANPDAVVGSQQELATYQFMAFLAPNTAACDKKGIGFASGANTYIRADFISDLNIFKHEIGHNFGLQHSSLVKADGKREEYGDGSSPMGYCPRCTYASPQLLWLGWARAKSYVDWSAFAPGTMRVSLKPLTDDPAQTVVVRLESPLAGTIKGTDVYVSYRVRKGIDASLPDRFHRATSVHTVEGNTWLLAWLTDGQGFSDPANKIAVTQTSSSDGGAEVAICRWSADASECGSFTPFTMPAEAAAAAAAAAGEGGAPADLVAYYGSANMKHEREDGARR